MFGRKRKFENVDVEITERDKLSRHVGYDPYPVWCEEIKRENERKEAEVSAEHKAALSEYREARRHLDTWKPIVQVKDYAAGKFLCFEGHEVPITHIESIEVLNLGGEPYKDEVFPIMPSMLNERQCWLYARVDKGIKDYPSSDTRMMPRKEPANRVFRNEAKIGVRMTSGRLKEITCWDFQVEIVREALEQAWKHGKTP